MCKEYAIKGHTQTMQINISTLTVPHLILRLIASRILYILRPRIQILSGILVVLFNST